jgi:hypothetical protein
MARKLCPACKVVNAGSATQCRCGHAFDVSTMVVSKPVRRCPLCGLVADSPGAASCRCGYDFDSAPSTVRPQIELRKKYGWIWIFTGISCVVLSVGVLFVQVLLGGLTAIFGAYLIAKGMSTLSWTRSLLRDLDAEARQLPAARVVSDPKDSVRRDR